jgi:hypothetical protein
MEPVYLVKDRATGEVVDVLDMNEWCCGGGGETCGGCPRCILMQYEYAGIADIVLRPDEQGREG